MSLVETAPKDEQRPDWPGGRTDCGSEAPEELEKKSRQLQEKRPLPQKPMTQQKAQIREKPLSQKQVTQQKAPILREPLTPPTQQKSRVQNKPQHQLNPLAQRKLQAVQQPSEGGAEATGVTRSADCPH